MISIILTIHNKEDLIGKVYDSIIQNKSSLTNEIIVVLDGCTDNSESIINGIEIPDKIIYTPDVHEVKANNAGLQQATQKYSLLIQDDMVIQEQYFDKILLKPFQTFDDVFAVTGRQTTNDRISDSHIVFTDFTKNQFGLFQVRDVAIRGPLLIRNDILKELNYLDEYFAPVTFDDHDICLRAKEQFGLVSGAYPILVESRPEWGTTRQKNQSKWQEYYNTNEQRLIERHSGTLLGDRVMDDRKC